MIQPSGLEPHELEMKRIATVKTIDGAVSFQLKLAQTRLAGANRFDVWLGAGLGTGIFPGPSLHKLSSRAGARRRPIASLWRARHSIAVTSECSWLAPIVER